jgi:hypothetical protein
MCHPNCTIYALGQHLQEELWSHPRSGLLTDLQIAVRESREQKAAAGPVPYGSNKNGPC